MPASVPVRRLRVSAVAALVPLAALAGCGGLGQPQAYDQPGINGIVVPTPSPDPDDFVDGVDNPWLPLEPGDTARYDVTRDGVDLGSIDTTVLDATTDVGGLAATSVEMRTETRTGTTTASSVETRLYAQDEDGNVWLVGVESDGDSWLAGADGAEAGLAMPAHLRIGDGWLAYAVPSLPETSRRVEDLSSTQVQMLDEADTSSRTVYEKGVGLVSTEDLDDGSIAVLVR